MREVLGRNRDTFIGCVFGDTSVDLPACNEKLDSEHQKRTRRNKGER